jgi:hypothetical protein
MAPRIIGAPGQIGSVTGHSQYNRSDCANEETYPDPPQVSPVPDESQGCHYTSFEKGLNMRSNE